MLLAKTLHSFFRDHKGSGSDERFQKLWTGSLSALSLSAKNNETDIYILCIYICINVCFVIVYFVSLLSATLLSAGLLRGGIVCLHTTSPPLTISDPSNETWRSSLAGQQNETDQSEEWSPSIVTLTSGCSDTRFSLTLHIRCSEDNMPDQHKKKHSLLLLFSSVLPYSWWEENLILVYTVKFTYSAL